MVQRPGTADFLNSLALDSPLQPIWVENDWNSSKYGSCTWKPLGFSTIQITSRRPSLIFTRSKVLWRSLRGKLGLQILARGTMMMGDEIEHDSHRFIIIHWINREQLCSFFENDFSWRSWRRPFGRFILSCRFRGFGSNIRWFGSQGVRESLKNRVQNKNL